MKNFLYFAPDDYLSSLPKEDWYLVIGAGIENINVNSNLQESRLDTKDVSNWLAALQITSILTQTQTAPKFIIWKQSSLLNKDDGWFKLDPSYMPELIKDPDWLNNDMIGSYHKTSSTILQYYIQQFCKSLDIDIFVIKPNCDHQKSFIERADNIELKVDFVVTKDMNLI